MFLKFLKKEKSRRNSFPFSSNEYAIKKSAKETLKEEINERNCFNLFITPLFSDNAKDKTTNK